MFYCCLQAIPIQASPVKEKGGTKAANLFTESGFLLARSHVYGGGSVRWGAKERPGSK